jgi:hypothetical protein
MNKEPLIAVGIDNGLTGGAAAISLMDGKLIDRIAMPVERRAGKAQPDVRAFRLWLASLESPLEVWIEEPLKRAPSSQSMRSMAMGFGMLYGSMLMNPQVVKLSAVQVIDWHRALLPGVPQGLSKAAAAIVAGNLEPGEKWRASARCTTAHDGIIDAFLIAHFGRNGGVAPALKKRTKKKV